MRVFFLPKACARLLRTRRLSTGPALGRIPVVDVSSFLADHPGNDPNSVREARETAAAKLDAACTELGFFYLAGHGVPQELTDQMRAEADSFFREPQELKEEIAVHPGCDRGYQRIGQNVTQGEPDQHEGVDFYRELEPDHHLLQPGGLEASKFTGNIQTARQLIASRNRFPRRPAELKPLVERYSNQMLELSEAVMKMMGAALDFPESSNPFIEATRESFWVMRVINYPAVHTNQEVSSSFEESLCKTSMRRSRMR